MRHFLLLSSFALVLAATALAGCGIKPKELQPPKGAEDIDYPRTYPDPATDPRP
jgi:hypothetical protein